MRASAVAGLAALALVLGACGGDEPTANTTTTPELLPPSGTSTTGTGTTGLTSTTQSRVRTIEDDGSGGGQDVAPAPAPEPEAEPEPEPEPEPPAQPDNPKRDTPPPPGSSAERFEQFCAENPKQCGG